MPSDGDEIIYFPLNGTKMQTVIFYPSQWNDRICMRIELYGCVPGIYKCTSITNKAEMRNSNEAEFSYFSAVV